MSVSEQSYEPQALAQLLEQRKPVHEVNSEYEQGLSRLERLAIIVTERVGSMGFFFIILVWTMLWLGWNFLAPKPLQFDPPMAFVFWLFIANVIQLLLTPLIMVGQTLLSRHSELRAQSEYELTLAARNEIKTILQHLEYQNVILISMLHKLGISDAELQQAFRAHLVPHEGDASTMLPRGT